MRRRDTPPYHERRLQSVIRHLHAGRWSANVPAHHTTTIEEDTSCGHFQLRRLRHYRRHPQQSLFFHRAIQRTMGLLVCARELNSTHRRQFAIRLAILPQDLPDPKHIPLTKSIWQQRPRSEWTSLDAQEKLQTATRHAARKEELRSKRWES